MNKPLVSVIMPVYNGEKFVTEAIESILSQTYVNWELIIVNDGSTDDTAKNVSPFLKNERIKYYKHNKNLGYAFACNTAFRLCKGNYIAIQDSDDISLPNRLKKEVEILEKYKECVLTFSQACIIDIHGRFLSVWRGSRVVEGVLSPEKIFHKLYLEGNFMPNPSIMIRKLKNINPWYNPIFKSANDYEYNLRMLHDFPSYYIEAPLVKKRGGKMHKNMVSFKKTIFIEERKILYHIYRLYRKDGRLPITFSIYRRAMFFQLIKESKYFTNNNSKLKGKLLAIKATLYNPLDKNNLIFLISKIFGLKVLNFFVKIKKIFIHQRIAMNVAFIIQSFPVISETFILNQITGLIDLGHKVDIFAFSRSDEKKVHCDVIKYNLLRKATFFNELPQDKTERIVRATKIVLRYFIFYPKEIIKCLNYKKYGGKYYALNNLFKLAPFLRKKYDVIHCHFGPNALHSLFLKEILGRRVKFITTFHAYDISRFLTENPNGIYKSLFRTGDLFLPISNLWKEKLERLGCPKEKIVVHRMGVDTEKNKFRAMPIDNDEINIITVARLVEKKGLGYSISAVIQLIKKYPKLQYLIVGEGYLREKLQNLIFQSGAKDKIRMLGQLESDNVRKLMYKSHIFLLASVTSEDGDQEGIPVSLMEAMAAGLPVISTFHSAIPELIRDKESGFLVSEKHIEGIAEKIEILISNPALRMQFAQAGRWIVERDFNIKKQTKRLMNIYAKCTS